MKYEIPQMLKQGGGIIVNTASMAGLVGFEGLPAYNASKGGVSRTQSERTGGPQILNYPRFSTFATLVIAVEPVPFAPPPLFVAHSPAPV